MLYLYPTECYFKDQREYKAPLHVPADEATASLFTRRYHTKIMYVLIKIDI